MLLEEAEKEIDCTRSKIEEAVQKRKHQALEH